MESPWGCWSLLVCYSPPIHEQEEWLSRSIDVLAERLVLLEWQVKTVQAESRAINKLLLEHLLGDKLPPEQREDVWKNLVAAELATLSDLFDNWREVLRSEARQDLPPLPPGGHQDLN